MARSPWLLPLAIALGCPACRDLDRFDTTDGAEYCGSIVGAQFVRTPLSEGGFQRRMRLGLSLDVDHLTDQPGVLSSDDAEDGPCSPMPTFDRAPLQSVPELSHDALSSLTFGEEQEHNIIAWVGSSCRGPMLAVVSLLRNNDVDVRLLRPATGDGSESERPAFSLFKLSRREGGCEY